MIPLLAKPVVEEMNARTRSRVEAFRSAQGRAPRLAVVIIGNDPASAIYVRKKGEAAVALGMEHETLALPASTSPEQARAEIRRLNEDPAVDAILLQRPLPRGYVEEAVVYWISPDKDVDGFHPDNVGRLALGLPCLRPCTPAGIMALLAHYGIDPAGKTACVIGRSSIVGKPIAMLLLQADATVIHCHSRTPDLGATASRAEILVAAIGKPGIIDASFVREGAVVVDVGINRDSSGRVVGDVRYQEISAKARAATPVPGGVGPMTIAQLLENTALAAELRARKPRTVQ